jgi:hypothetical protein
VHGFDTGELRQLIAVDASTFAARSGSVTYSVAANLLGTSRQGTIQIGSAVFTVVQSGAPCAYSPNEYAACSAPRRRYRARHATATACTPATAPTNRASFLAAAGPT